MALLGSANHTIVDVDDNYVAVLTNESHTLPANSSGTVTSYAGASTKINIYRGATQELDTLWTYTLTKSSTDAGFTASITTSGLLSVSAFPASLDSGYVDVTATYNGISLVKRFSISKSKQGTGGANGVAYWLVSSSDVLKRGTNNLYTPATITIKNMTANGSSVLNYAGIFKIYEATDANGEVFGTPVYSSGATEIERIYTPPSYATKQITAVKIESYLSNGSTLVDTVTIPVLLDGEKGTPGDKGDPGDKGEKGDSALSVMILNENQTIATTSARTASSAQVIDIPFTAYLGSERIAATATYGVLPSGVTLASNTAATATSNGLLKFNVASGANFGGTTTAFDAGRIDITVTANGVATMKPFNWSKGVAGAAGATARTFFVEPNVSVIVKNVLGNYSPTSVTFSSYYKDGTNATKVAYARYWGVESTTDGINWTSIATQTTTSTTYTIAVPAGVIGLRATTYSTTALTAAVAHDTQSVMVVTDGEKGATGDRGPTGPTGTSVTGVTEYYLATASASGVTTATAGWTTTMQNMTTTAKYLWNYEKISFSDGSSSNTIPVIIGVYGDTGGKGDTGATGRSITGITEYYLATSASSGVTRSTAGWTTAMQTTDTTKKYLWNYEVVTWSSGTTTTYIEPIIIGVHGATGPTGATTYTWVKYADDANGAGISDSPTGKRYLGLAPGKTSASESNTPSDYTWSPLYDNVKVGVRNLIPNSGNFQDVGTWSDYSTVDIQEKDGFQTIHSHGTIATPDLYVLEADTEYVCTVEFMLSAEFTASNSVPNHIYVRKQDGTNAYQYLNIVGGNRVLAPNVWHKITVSFKTIATTDLPLFFKFHLYTSSIATEKWVKTVKLESGNIATDWTAAPEDLGITATEKANAAQEAAEAFADAQAALAIAEAEAYADGIVTDEETARITDAANKLAEAKLHAEQAAADAVGALDLSGYATNQIVEDLEINLKKEISSTTGLNMLRNSIGYAKLDYWEHTVAGNGVVTAIMNERLRVLGYGSGFHFPPQSGTTSKGIQQTVNVTAGQPYTLSWFLNRATAGAFIVSIYEGTTLKQTIPDSSNVDGEFSTEYYVYIPEGNQLTVRFEAEASTEALLTGVMLGLGTMPTQWTLANGELYNAYVRIDDNGLVVLRVDENGDIEGFTNMTPEEFAGYYDENRDGEYERIFWFNRDETVTKKLKALDEITMGTIKIVRVEGALNRGWAFVPIIPEE